MQILKKMMRKLCTRLVLYMQIALHNNHKPFYAYIVVVIIRGT